MIDTAVEIADASKLRHAAWIKTGAAMVEFIASAMQQRERGITISDAGKITRQVGQPMRYEMHPREPVPGILWRSSLR